LLGKEWLNFAMGTKCRSKYGLQFEVAEGGRAATAPLRETPVLFCSVVAPFSGN